MTDKRDKGLALQCRHCNSTDTHIIDQGIGHDGRVNKAAFTIRCRQCGVLGTAFKREQTNRRLL